MLVDEKIRKMGEKKNVGGRKTKQEGKMRERQAKMGGVLMRKERMRERE